MMMMMMMFKNSKMYPLQLDLQLTVAYSIISNSNDIGICTSVRNLGGGPPPLKRNSLYVMCSEKRDRTSPLPKTPHKPWYMKQTVR